MTIAIQAYLNEMRTKFDREGKGYTLEYDFRPDKIEVVVCDRNVVVDMEFPLNPTIDHFKHLFKQALIMVALQGGGLGIGPAWVPPDSVDYSDFVV